MIWRNWRGDLIDPAPFIVTSLLAIMIVFSFGPVYAMEYGLSLEVGLGLSTVLTGSIIVGSYHRLIWRARPDMRTEIPVQTRLQRLFYAVIAGVILLSALTYPIVAG